MEKKTAVKHQQCHSVDHAQCHNNAPSLAHSGDGYQSLMLHIPHASTTLPSGMPCPATLDDEEWRLIDLHTDELFAPIADGDHRIQAVIFPFCRLFCDVERLPDDPLEERGLGISYRRTMPDGRIRSWGERGEAYKRYARYHCDVVERIIDHGLQPAAQGSLLIIDCHSFSLLPNLLNANPPQDIDICIGYNDDGTKPSEAVISSIHRFFRSRGYRVGINTPFANSKTFDVPGGNHYHSVMIEVSKRLYMNESTRAKIPGFNHLHHDLQTLYTMLLRE